MCAHIVVPTRVLVGAALRGDDEVLAVVLDAHERGLVELARLRADVGHEHDRATLDGVRLRAVRRLERLGLLARPARRARRVLAFQRHEPSSVALTIPAYRSAHSDAQVGWMTSENSTNPC